MTRLRKGSKRLEERVSSSREALLALIDQFLDLLASPLDEAEVSAGWSVPRVVHIRGMLLDVRARIASLEPVPYTPLVRWADHMGISSGTLLERLATIDVGLNNRTW